MWIHFKLIWVSAQREVGGGRLVQLDDGHGDGGGARPVERVIEMVEVHGGRAGGRGGARGGRHAAAERSAEREAQPAHGGRAGAWGSAGDWRVTRGVPCPKRGMSPCVGGMFMVGGKPFEVPNHHRGLSPSFIGKREVLLIVREHNDSHVQKQRQALPSGRIN